MIDAIKANCDRSGFVGRKPRRPVEHASKKLIVGELNVKIQLVPPLPWGGRGKFDLEITRVARAGSRPPQPQRTLVTSGGFPIHVRDERGIEAGICITLRRVERDLEEFFQLPGREDEPIKRGFTGWLFTVDLIKKIRFLEAVLVRCCRPCPALDPVKGLEVELNGSSFRLRRKNSGVNIVAGNLVPACPIVSHDGGCEWGWRQ